MGLIKNSSLVIGGIIVSNILAYAFHFIAGRMLGPAAYGIFGALMALFLLFALPAGALSFAITKYTAKFNSENEFGKIGILRKKIQNIVIVIFGIVFLLIILFSQFIANFLKLDSVIPVIIIGITLIFSMLLPVNRGILQGLKKFQLISFNIIIEAVFRLALLVIFIYLGYGYNGAILAYGGAYFIAFLMIFPFIKDTRVPIIGSEQIEIKPIYRFILQVLIVNIVLQSILNVPSILVKHFYSSEIAGYWTAAFNIARLSLFMTGAISLVMFPEIAGTVEPALKKRIFYKAMILVSIATVSLAILFFILPQYILQNLYGSAYLGAVPFLKWMGFAMIFFGMLQLRTDYFFAKQK